MEEETTIKAVRKPVRIIFLDIDSVLATHRVQFSKLERGVLEHYDPIIVDFFDSICSKYLCYIVVTSRSRTIHEYLNCFKTKMVQSDGSLITDFIFPDDDLWRTTKHILECTALEIDDWFERFEEKFKDRFYIENYAIVDNNTLGSISMHDNHFVHVKDTYNGMGCSEYRELIKILERG